MLFSCDIRVCFFKAFAFYACYKLEFITFTLIADLLCVWNCFVYFYFILFCYYNYFIFVKKSMGIFRLRGGLTHWTRWRTVSGNRWRRLIVALIFLCFYCVFLIISGCSIVFFTISHVLPFSVYFKIFIIFHALHILRMHQIYWRHMALTAYRVNRSAVSTCWLTFSRSLGQWVIRAIVERFLLKFYSLFFFCFSLFYLFVRIIYAYKSTGSLLPTTSIFAAYFVPLSPYFSRFIKRETVGCINVTAY